MQLLLICFILHQMVMGDGNSDAPNVNLTFFKNVTANYTLLKEIHEAVINFRPIMLKRGQDNDKTVNYELYDTVTKDLIKTKVYSKMKYKYHIMLQKYEVHAMKRGSQRFRDIPYYMSIELHIAKDRIPPLHNFIKNFTKKARGFFNEAYKQNFSTNIDKEFSLLDTVESFNALVYDEELSLLNDIIFKYNVSLTTHTMMIILKHFYNEFIENKKADTDYICLKFDICRPTLRFTDYIGDIAREFVKLSDSKLTSILLKLSIYIKEQSTFFETILGKKSAVDIGTKLEELLFRDVTGIRNKILDLRSYLARRHKFNQTGDEETKTKNNVLRILVDIIDQAFDVNGDEILAMHFNIILKSIVDWSEGRNNEIQNVLKTFVKHTVEVMKINLSDEAINEIKALVDILMGKEDKSDRIYQYLLYHGSTFVRGEDIAMKLSLLL